MEGRERDSAFWQEFLKSSWSEGLMSVMGSLPIRSSGLYPENTSKAGFVYTIIWLRMMMMQVGKFSDTCLYWTSISSAASWASLNLLISMTVKLTRLSVILLPDRLTQTGPLSRVRKRVSIFFASSPESKALKKFCWSSVLAKKLEKRHVRKVFSGISQQVFKMGIGEVDSICIFVHKDDAGL